MAAAGYTHAPAVGSAAASAKKPGTTRRRRHGKSAAGVSDGFEASGQALPRPSRSSLGIKPDEVEVLRAIESLYVDQLKPFGRILRKRIAEHAVAGSYAESYIGSADVLPDVDIKHLKAICDTSQLLHVEPEEGGDWSAAFVGRMPDFVDIYSSDDAFSFEFWEEAAAYFESLTGDAAQLPGGRYSCAQALLARDLGFLADMSLGQVCHMVQLGISLHKIVGYCNGAVVPYAMSQSMVKEQCAASQRPCGAAAETGTGAASSLGALPLADLETARRCLQQILESSANPDLPGPAMVPLSNVKRLFRSRYSMELSETTLGHSKLSELLQDQRFSDICSVELQGNGYIVVQTQPSSFDRAAAEDNARIRGIEGLEMPPPTPTAGRHPFYSRTGSLNLDMPTTPAGGHHPLYSRTGSLNLDVAYEDGGGEANTPDVMTPEDSPGEPTPNTFQRWLEAPPYVPFAPANGMYVGGLPAYPGMPPAGYLGMPHVYHGVPPGYPGMHTEVPTACHGTVYPPPPPAYHAPITSTMPPQGNYYFAEMHSWHQKGSGQSSSMQVLGTHPPRPAPAWTGSGREPTPPSTAYVKGCAPAQSRTPEGNSSSSQSPEDSASPEPPLKAPMPRRRSRAQEIQERIREMHVPAELDEIDGDEDKAFTSHLTRFKFAVPDTPLGMEARSPAGDLSMANRPLATPGTPGAQRNMPLSRWPQLSPSLIGEDGIAGQLVRNTFIDTALTPVTPEPGFIQRSRSVPKNLGSDRCWEAVGHEALNLLPRPGGPSQSHFQFYNIPATPIASPAYMPPPTPSTPLFYQPGGVVVPATGLGSSLPPHRVIRLSGLI